MASKVCFDHGQGILHCSSEEEQVAEELLGQFDELWTCCGGPVSGDFLLYFSLSSSTIGEVSSMDDCFMIVIPM